MKISVIMPSFLGQYPNCANKRTERFIFAVNSFINQTYKNSELCICSDGCNITDNIYNKQFKSNKRIKHIRIDKQSHFSGETRNKAIEISNGDYICFLDTDDFFGKDHLRILSSQIKEEYDWMFYNDYIYHGRNTFQKRSTRKETNKNKMIMGTSSIIYKNHLTIKWGDGYGHDHHFIRSILHLNHTKLKKNPQYFICHVPVQGPQFDLDKPYCYTS